MTVILVHGWGYDAGVWDAVRAQLNPALPVETLDLGYFGKPKVGAGETAGLAVGHSLGALWWLTQTEIPWRRLLSINGFPRFTAAQGYAGIAPRVLARMRQQFAVGPAAVLADFHSRCSGIAPAGNPDVTELAAGLGMLAELDARTALASRSNDVWALAGSDDPIVPHAMSVAAFAGLPAGHLEFVEAPGHLLPLTHPALCAQWIGRLAA